MYVYLSTQVRPDAREVLFTSILGEVIKILFEGRKLSGMVLDVVDCWFVYNFVREI